MSGYAVFVGLYLLALIAVGAWKARKVRTQEDFTLAGRGLPVWVLAGTLLATWIGTGSIFGNAQKALELGAATFLLPLSAVLGILTLYLLSARIRRFGQFTVQDILQARFGVEARVLGTITLLLAYVIIVSYQYRAGAAVVQRLYPGIGEGQAITCVAVFVVAYTALAGLYSVAYTDVANGILMTLGVVLAIPYVWAEVGGLEGARAALPPERVAVFGQLSPLKVVSYLLPAYLLMIGDANMYQRFFSARSPAEARRSTVYMFVGVVVLECAIILLAWLGGALVARGDLAAPENPGHIVVSIAFDALPAWLGALLLGTVVAVVVSTADSYLLSPSSAVVRDLYQQFVEPGMSPRKAVLVSRVVVVLLGAVALGLAFTSDRFFEVALFAYTVYGAGITPALLAAFFWPRATRAGALCSMMSGVLTSIVWQFIVVEGAAPGSWVEQVDAVIPAVLLAVVVLVVVSLLTPPPSPEQARAV